MGPAPREESNNRSVEGMFILKKLNGGNLFLFM
jgi:hypothetical protein